MLDALMNSPIAWAILSVLTILGVVLSIYFGIKSKKVKRISFSKRSHRLVEKGKKSVDKLKLLFEGDEVENVTITKLTIWNSGNTVINNVDIVSSKRLVVTSEGDSKILEVQVIAMTEEANGIVVNMIDQNTISLDFEYLNVKDGVALQIIHTGEEGDIQVKCKIKGGKEIKEVITGMSKNNNKKLNRFKTIYKKAMVVYLGIVSILTVLMTISLLAYRIIKWQSSIYVNNEADWIISVILLAILCIVLFYMLRIMAKDAFNIGVPNKLKRYLTFDE